MFGIAWAFAAVVFLSFFFVFFFWRQISSSAFRKRGAEKKRGFLLICLHICWVCLPNTILWGRRHFDHRRTHRLVSPQRGAFINGYWHVTFWSYKESHWELSVCYLKTGSDDSSSSYLIDEEVCRTPSHLTWMIPAGSWLVHSFSWVFTVKKSGFLRRCVPDTRVCVCRVFFFLPSLSSCTIAHKVKLSRGIGGGL